MKAVLVAIDTFSRWTGKFISYVMFLVMAIVCFEITMRYVFQRPTLWATESMLFACAFLYILGGAWTMLENRHVKIDVLWERLSSRRKRMFDLFTFMFFALYMGLLLWAGFKYAWDSVELAETSGSPWNPPVYPVKIMFVVGVAILSLQGIAKFIRDLYFVITQEEL